MVLGAPRRMSARLAMMALVCSLLVSTLVTASARGRGVAIPPDVADVVGVRLEDESIAAAIEMFENGKSEGAIESLVKVIKDPNSAKNVERDGELRAGLGVIYARAGDFPKAKAMLESAMKEKESASLRPRVRVLLAAVAGAQKEGTKGSKDLKEREAWLKAVENVRRDLEVKLEDRDKVVSKAVEDGKWSELKELVETSRETAEEVDAIEVGRKKSEEIVSTHRAGLERLSKEIGEDIADEKNLMNGIHPKKEARGPNNRVRRKELIVEKGDHRAMVRTLEEAQRLIDEARGISESAGAGHAKKKNKRK